jgi:hypothetical protein
MDNELKDYLFSIYDEGKVWATRES